MIDHTSTTDECKAMANQQLENGKNYTAEDVTALLNNDACHVRQKHVGDGRHRPEVPTGPSGMSSAFPDEGVLAHILADALNSTEGQKALQEIMTTAKVRREQSFNFQVGYNINQLYISDKSS